MAAYDAIARSGVSGPKIVVREELEHMDSKSQDHPLSTTFKALKLTFLTLYLLV